MKGYPKRVKRRFPGNIGEGIRSEAARKIVKKTIRIVMPFILISSFVWNKNI